eukprot:CAMPEP_0113724368 /NCGR_PEP_ID=MMETSP0038_2-20120614/39034_1 /TAXON_ID=2898 /ORGANISM="Cryptomonas paramecium" /LENGTH=166 /DNA_ID=CAMNT_0000654249 /DNA_START=104 /DNA_END=600 /DNA_ORIENTATION=+ /assembly_acc=CAM_ASM_000170
MIQSSQYLVSHFSCVLQEGGALDFKESLLASSGRLLGLWLRRPSCRRCTCRGGWRRACGASTPEWDPNSKRATKILFQGEPQCATSSEFMEYTYDIPLSLRAPLTPEVQLMVGFCSEYCTEYRSASCELGQVAGLVASPPVLSSVYLQGRLASGVWREYPATLAAA